MKRLRFNKLNGWRNGILISLTLICMLSGAFVILGNSQTEWNKILGIFGSNGIVIFFAIISFGKYYVGWNSVGINIRINTFLGKSFNFKDVKSSDFENQTLTVTKKDGKKIQLDISEIQKTDIDRLNEIISENTASKNISL